MLNTNDTKNGNRFGKKRRLCFLRSPKSFLGFEKNEVAERSGARAFKAISTSPSC